MQGSTPATQRGLVVMSRTAGWVGVEWVEWVEGEDRTKPKEGAEIKEGEEGR